MSRSLHIGLNPPRRHREDKRENRPLIVETHHERRYKVIPEKEKNSCKYILRGRRGWYLRAFIEHSSFLSGCFPSSRSNILCSHRRGTESQLAIKKNKMEENKKIPPPSLLYHKWKHECCLREVIPISLPMIEFADLQERTSIFHLRYLQYSFDVTLHIPRHYANNGRVTCRALNMRGLRDIYANINWQAQSANKITIITGRGRPVHLLLAFSFLPVYLNTQGIIIPPLSCSVSPRFKRELTHTLPTARSSSIFSLAKSGCCRVEHQSNRKFRRARLANARERAATSGEKRKTKKSAEKRTSRRSIRAQVAPIFNTLSAECLQWCLFFSFST